MRGFSWLFEPGLPAIVPAPDPRDVALEHARGRISDLVLRNVELAKLNLELTREVIRVSQRIVPVVETGPIEDPPTTAEADRIAARRGEQSQTPAPGVVRSGAE